MKQPKEKGKIILGPPHNITGLTEDASGQHWPTCSGNTATAGGHQFYLKNNAEIVLPEPVQNGYITVWGSSQKSYFCILSLASYQGNQRVLRLNGCAASQTWPENWGSVMQLALFLGHAGG